MSPKKIYKQSKTFMVKGRIIYDHFLVKKREKMQTKSDNFVARQKIIYTQIRWNLVPNLRLLKNN